MSDNPMKHSNDDACNCPACQLRRMLQAMNPNIQAAVPIGIGMGGGMVGLDIKQLTTDLIKQAPPFARPNIVCDMIVNMCLAATVPEVPEDERGNVEAWEGRTPRDFFDTIVDMITAVDLPPDAEAIVESWNNHQLQEAEEMVKSKDPLTIPEDWTRKND